MVESRTVTVGLDVHARSIRLAAVRADELLEERTLPYDEEAVERILRRWPGVRCCYEAGPTGFGLYRRLVDGGIECEVVAPGLVPRRPGDRVKTDPRDARARACFTSSLAPTAATRAYTDKSPWPALSPSHSGSRVVLPPITLGPVEDLRQGLPFRPSPRVHGEALAGHVRRRYRAEVRLERTRRGLADADHHIHEFASLFGDLHQSQCYLLCGMLLGWSGLHALKDLLLLRVELGLREDASVQQPFRPTTMAATDSR
jgi:hypothetical protein